MPRGHRVDDRGGAVSVVQAFRFAGAAFSPALFCPIYDASAAAGFLVPACLLAVIAPLALLSERPCPS